MTEYINYTEAAGKIGTSIMSISRWVNVGKLEAGPDRGKSKTVTLDSVNMLLSDDTFRQSLNRAQRRVRPKAKPAPDNTNTRINRLERLLEQAYAKINELQLTLDNVISHNLTLDNVKQQSLDNKQVIVSNVRHGKNPGPDLAEMRAAVIDAVAAGVPKNRLCAGSNTRNVDNIVRGTASIKTVRLAWKLLQEYYSNNGNGNLL